MVNLELYRVFYTVAKCGSLTRAADELFISQPAVSQAIKQLEGQLGVSLFNRTHRGMELSEQSGKQIFPIVERALRELDEAENKLKEMNTTATGTIRISASDTIFSYALIDKIAEYHEKYPEVKLNLINCITTETLELLKNNRCDVAFLNLPVDDKDFVLSSVMMPLHDTFVANEKYATLSESVQPLKSMHDYPLLMLGANTVTRKAIINFSHSIGVHLHPEIECGSLEIDDQTCGERRRDRLRAAGIRAPRTGRRESARDQDGTGSARPLGGDRFPEKSADFLCGQRVFENV